jgi:acyl-CoA synthetase (AMP-forming)/AMP-acid ligase II
LPPPKILGHAQRKPVIAKTLRSMTAESSVSLSPLVPYSSLPHLLEHQAEHIPAAPAILAPGRATLTYGLLYEQIDSIGRALRTMGVGRRDRVAVVLPNGPEMAVAILAIEAWAVCAPINPACSLEELEKSFADLQARALITQAGLDSPARLVARSQGIRELELTIDFDKAAGLFTLCGDPEHAVPEEPVSSSDVALLLPTSGTTSRPKIVPLTHGNICRSAHSHGVALALSTTDRCLNVLPLFHGHGLNATLLASLASGASVVCTPGCEVDRFFGWLSEFQPTWYSAVPAMHQAILSQAAHNRERISECRLRFLRSSSAPLPSRIFRELEQTFETPVIEWYGMTETASAPIACNPLPPRQRKAGSVGVPAGLDVAIIDETGTFLSWGRTGQIVVRGASVMLGYDRNPMASRTAFSGDWFKTGDLGFFDNEGCLFLTSRIQEIINRGGEKIAPREIDEVLVEHPAVAESVTFAVPHRTLGEDVGSAVVLRPDARATPKDIRQFVIGRVADFKVPRQVLIVDELPKGATGKVQRLGLAAKLGLAHSGANAPIYVAPRTPLEQVLAEHWAEILRTQRVGVHDDFFALGGDSLLVTDVLAHVYTTTHLDVEAARFFEAPTVAELAHHLETLRQAGQTTQPASVIVRVPRDIAVPVSIPQERLWKQHKALRDIPLFNVLYPLRLPSEIDAGVLERSVNELVQRHEILRTTFTTLEHRCVQVIAPQLTVHLTCDDLSEMPDSEKEAVGYRLIQEEALHSFDIERGPLFRTRLARLADREHLLLITMHQIICDGWSLGVLIGELIALYDAFSAGEMSPLAPLSVQYADFAHWQRRWRSHPEIRDQLDYWREQLRDPLPVIRLSARRPRSIIDEFRTTRRQLALPTSLSEAIKQFSHDNGGTLFMALVTALQILFHRYLGEADCRVATLVANRNRPGTAELIGPLVNTVILRTDLGGDPSAREVMRRVRTTTLAAFAHQDLRFEELGETLERERAINPAALAQVMVTLQNATARAGSRFTPIFEEADSSILMPLTTMTTFDIILMLYESAHGLRGSCVYKPHLFDADTIGRLLQDFQSVLEQMVARPERPISVIRVPA